MFFITLQPALPSQMDFATVKFGNGDNRLIRTRVGGDLGKIDPL